MLVQFSKIFSTLHAPVVFIQSVQNRLCNYLLSEAAPMKSLLKAASNPIFGHGLHHGIRE